MILQNNYKYYFLNVRNNKVNKENLGENHDESFVHILKSDERFAPSVSLRASIRIFSDFALFKYKHASNKPYRNMDDH